MSEELEDYQAALLTTFGDVLRAEQAVSSTKTALDQATLQLKAELAQQETLLADAWGRIGKLLAETGEFEVTLPGESANYRIGWSSVREAAQVSADAVPEEFVRVERKPKLKEIGEHLKALRDADQPFPNWGRLERGESKLQYRLVKKVVA